MNKNEQQDDKLHISKSVFQTSREMQEKAQEEARKRNEEIQRRYAKKQKKAQEAHDKRLEEERLELLRLKTGVIEDSELIHEEVPEEIHQTFWQKIGSFIYLNKWWLGMGAVFTAIAVFLVVSLATKPRPDMVVLIVGNNQSLGEESHLDKYLEQFTPDNNKNGKILVSVYYIPYSGNERADFANSVPQKLSAELQSAESVILIGNELIGDVVTPEDTFTDLSTRYPGNKHVNRYKFMLSDTDFAEKVGVPAEDITKDWFIAVRKPQALIYSDEDDMQKTFDKDIDVFDAIINDLSQN